MLTVVIAIACAVACLILLPLLLLLPGWRRAGAEWDFVERALAEIGRQGREAHGDEEWAAMCTPEWPLNSTRPELRPPAPALQAEVEAECKDLAEQAGLAIGRREAEGG